MIVVSGTKDQNLFRSNIGKDKCQVHVPPTPSTLSPAVSPTASPVTSLLEGVDFELQEW